MDKFSVNRWAETIAETFALARNFVIAGILLVVLVVMVAGYWFIRSAPPTTLTISSGPEGSVFQTNAEKYRALLATNGVTLKIIPSKGSLENLQRLSDRSQKVDLAFVQGGVAGNMKVENLMSLGSVAYQPLLVFYRSPTPVALLSEFNGKKLSIGPIGSGTRSLSLTLLATNGVSLNSETNLLDLDAEASATALLDGRIDALFLMGDSASPAVMRKLLRSSTVRLLDFTQTDAYSRRFSYLNRLELPPGSIDLGKGIPAASVHLIGPTVELIARRDLHPALSDLVLEAAREVHGAGTILQRRGEFPAPLEHEFPISEDAARFYKTGKTFLYRTLPFWLASLVNRGLVVLVPAFVVLIPVLRLLPSIYRWRMRSRIYPWYRALLRIERDLIQGLPSGSRNELLQRLDEIEHGVNELKLPASFADQFYELRGHIHFVRGRLLQQPKP